MNAARSSPSRLLWLLLLTPVCAVAGPARAPEAGELMCACWPGLLLLLLAAALPASASAAELLDQLSTAVLDAIGSLIVVMDPTGRIVRFNRACRELTGRSGDGVIGQTPWAAHLLQPEDADQLQSLFAELAPGSFPNAHETHWLTASGEHLLIAWTTTALVDAAGQVRYVIASGLDVTEQRQAEEALLLDDMRLESLVRLNEMKYEPLQAITDYALEAAVRLTRSRLGYLAFLSEDETILTMHAWSKSAMSECAIIDKPIVYPVETTGLWGEAVRQRRPVITNDYQAPNPLKRGYPAGHVHVTRHLNIPVFDGEQIVAVAGIGNKDSDYDETDVRQLGLLMKGMWQLLQRKQMTEELREARADLEQRVLERTRELELANAQLADEIAEREHFVYAASHDLQEPLRKIGAFGGLLQQDCQDQLTDEGKLYLGRMVDGADRMRQLIDALLAYSRVTTHQQPFEYVSLAQETERVLEDLAFGIAEKHAQVVVDTPHVVRGDPVQVRQLLQNLIGNAVKFARAGVPPEVRVHSISLPDGSVELSVADNGIGFDERYLERIFRPFQRLHARNEYPGTGMGLAICEKIATRHGGSITATSQLGVGTVFLVRLPGAGAHHDGG